MFSRLRAATPLASTRYARVISRLPTHLRCLPYSSRIRWFSEGPSTPSPPSSASRSSKATKRETNADDDAIPEPPRDLPELKPLPRTRTIRSASGDIISKPDPKEEEAEEDLWRGFPANLTNKKGDEAVKTKDLGDKLEYTWSPGQQDGESAKYVVTKVTPEIRAERARKARPLLMAILATMVGVYGYTLYKMTENPWKEAEEEVLAEEQDADLAAFEEQMKMQLELDEIQRNRDEQLKD